MNFDLDLGNINYVKITYKDRNEFMHCSKAMIKSAGEREIFASAKYEEDINIPTPQNVSISFVSDNGLYKANTKLKYIRYEEPYIFFYMVTPETLEYRQSREYFRVRMDEKAVITYNVDEETQKRLCCKTYDISANGIRVILNENIDFPEEVGITLLVNTKEIKIKAHYVRIDAEDDILKASFKYAEISEQDMDFISQQCIKNQLENKRRKNMI